MSLSERLGRVRGLLIDLDGVVYVGRHVVPGAPAFFARLRSASMPFRLITNNSSQTAERYAQKLTSMGVPVQQEEILTSAQATGAYLEEIAPAGAGVLLIGEEGLRTAVFSRGFRPEDDQPDFVVVGIDRSFTFQRLTQAVRAVSRGAHLVGANPDVSLPTEEGLVPGAGSLLAAITAATGVHATIVGKPEPTMLQVAARQMGLGPEAVAMVGDRLDTDIAGARRAGMVAVLVLTGIATEADIQTAPEQPDLVVPALPDLSTWLSLPPPSASALAPET